MSVVPESGLHLRSAGPAGRPSRGLPYRLAAVAGRSLAYCALLLPVAVAALVAALFGRSRTAAAWWRALRTGPLGAPPVDARRRAGPLAVAGHALISLLLGAAALAPLGVQVLLVLRGALYGLVDPGPYDHSWGGPSRAGAWLAHFLVGLPISAAGLAVLVGIAAVHQRLTAALDGARAARWLTPAALLICAGVALFVVAWTRQL